MSSSSPNNRTINVVCDRKYSTDMLKHIEDVRVCSIVFVNVSVCLLNFIHAMKGECSNQFILTAEFSDTATPQ
ncbi:hypothetical protein DQQ10_08200 [Pseudochryseolinea flava]|uniref:Uncharacterized protein n=1 Tax=Pseudochryseolinea flava TaxID=2059302 RepID=A0A364Y6A0_9BACT|nr:hypothetical protein DQQ10_08200 [Pseudochryseolinea flava]